MRRHGMGAARTAPALILALCLGLLSTGCLVGPDYAPPESGMPDHWASSPSTPAGSFAPADADLARWWTVFDDPVLVSLETRALQANLNLRQAQARLRQARAARGIAAGGLGPQLEGSAAYQRSDSPDLAGGDSGRSVSTLSDLYQAGFDASWEIDVFGGLRRELEAADADVETAREARREVMVSLTAEVALNYLELRTLQQRSAIARSNLKAQRDTTRLTWKRFEAGFVSGLDAANAEAQAASTAAGIPLLDAAARQRIHALGVLLGREPAALLPELSPSAAIPQAPPGVPAGLPSDLLRRRPDIRRAESQVRAANARIGAATADLFPRFFLTGAAGYKSASFDTWFDQAGGFWSFGPSMTWQVFQSGRIRANIELQDALTEEALWAYRQTVLTSLREVEDSLTSCQAEDEHRRELSKAVAANRKAVELSTRLYTEGETDFLSVLQAQGALYATEDALTQSNGTMGTNLISLFKGLGGGWREAAETASSDAPGGGAQSAK